MRKVLTLWVGIALAAASALTPHAQGAQLQRVPQATPSAIANLTPLGDLPATNHLSLAIGLPLRNQEALTNLLRQIYDPASPNFHHYLTVQEFTEQFGPTTADYEAVAAFAQAHGLRVIARHPNRLLLDVEGSVADIEKSLNVHFKRYQHPTEDREFYAPDASPQLDLSVPVLGISGLDNFSLPRPRLQVKPLTASANATPDNGSGPGGLYMGRDFRTAYASGTTLTGTGQTVGLLEFDGYTTSDITYYEGVAGLTNVPLTNVLLDGFSGAPSGGQVEVSLDIEVAISMAPGLSQMIVYEAGPYGNFHDILNRMANDNLAKQMSCSWYIPNGPADPVADGIFQEMAMQGQTFYAASGDSDAYSGLIPFPGDTPYITEVGGTTLTMSPGGGAYESETVWNWGYAGSSGGISTQYPIPSWQAPVSMAANYGSTTMRNTPDVAMTADSVYVRVDGDNLNVGGTSCAAPLWAGFTALINQQAAFYRQPMVGFFNPTIYTLGLGSSYGTTMHDITTGNNGTPTHFPAVAGYDLATGWGTPNGQPLIDAIVPPDTLIISPNTGFASVGGEGGPFSASTQTFVLTNDSSSNLNWSVSNSAPWLTISASMGTLGTGSSTNLVASLNSAASNLPPGNYSTVLLVSNLTTAFIHKLPFTLEVLDPLVIIPSNGFAAMGPVGGPFSIPAQNCTLSNAGLVPLNWSLSNDASWLDVTGTAGTLAPGTTTNLVVSLNNAANSLPPGLFTGDLLFSNLTWGSVQDLQFSLHTGELPVANGGFELGSFAGWTLSGNTIGESVSSNAQFVHSGTYGASLGPQGSLGHLSQSLTTVPGQVYMISFWLDNQGLGSANEFQVNWEGVNVYDQFNIGALSWTNIQVLVAANANNSVLDFGFVNNGYDFGLDDVEVFQVTGVPTNPPTVITQPTNETVTSGWTSQFSVGASGIQPYYYQWQFGGSNLIGQTNATLLLSPTLPADAGNYSVIVSNVFGPTNSSNALLTVNIPTCDPPAAGLVGWWAGEGNADDSFGTNNGTLVGGVTFTNGVVGQAFKFDGVSGYVDVPTSASLNPTTNLTCDAWVYPTQYPTALTSTGPIIKKTGQGSSEPYGYTLELHIDGTVGFAAYVNGVVFGANSAPLALNQWYYVAGVYDGTNMNIYLNGKLSGTVSAPGSITPSGNDFQIGHDPANPIRYFSGLIDEASLYNKALSAAQIQAIYDAGSAGKCGSAPIIAMQPTNEADQVDGTAMFSVGATGSQPLAYQWLLNSNLISATTNATATNATLILTNVQFGQSGGYYSVIVSNQLGSTNSSNALLTVNPAPPCDPPPSSLVSWWKGEGNANDSFNTNNGTLQGGVTFGPGEAGEAFDFNGVNQYVSVPNSTNWDFGTNDFTIELWAKFAAANQTAFLVGHDDGGGPENKWIFLVDGGLLQFHMNTTANNGQYVGSGSFNPVLNQWYHLAVTRSNLLYTFYVDGAVNSTGYNGTPTPVSTGPLTFGSAENGGYLAGGEDEVSIYNSALTAAQIQAIYNAGTSGKCQGQPLIAVQPTNATVFVGSTVTYSVSATGSQPLAYQWLLNSNPISATTNATATSSTLVLTNVQLAQSGGLYSVVITNSAGSTNSSNALLTVNPLPTCDPPPASLVSWWKGEGNANDSFGTNNGTLQGGVTFGPGEVGEAFDFNGVNQYVSVPNSTSWDFGTGDFTIELWAKFAAANQTAFLVGHDDGGGPENKWIFLVDGGLLQFHMNTTANNGQYVGSGAFNPVLNQWYHLAVTRSNLQYTFYVNGVVNSTGYNGTPTPVSTAPLTLGAAENGGYLSGGEDEVSIYNSALTGAQIQAIYNAGSSGKCPPEQAPLIVAQPTNVTIGVGNTATFSVTAIGSQPLNYQWLLNAAPISATTNATATNATLVLTNVQLGQSGGLYSVVVSNLAGSTNSSNALLTVTQPPCDPTPSNLLAWWRGEGNAEDSIGTNDGNISGGVTFTNGEVGQCFSFDGSTGFISNALSYLSNAANNFTIEFWAMPTAGRTATSQSQSGVEGIGGQRYAIFPHNPGNNSIMAGVGISVGTNGISVFEDGSFYLPSLLVYNATITGWTHIAVVYTNQQPLLYVNGTLVAAGLQSQRQASYPSTSMGEEGYGYGYYSGLLDEVSIYSRPLTTGEIQAIYEAGSAGKCPPVTAPVIVSQPSNESAVLGTGATFNVGATGTAPFAYQWLFNNSPISPLINPSAATATLSLSNVQATNAGNYSVLVTNIAGSTNSSNALLTILFPPSITLNPSGVYAGQGCDVIFKSGATGTGTLTYQWQKNGSNLIGQTGTNLAILDVQPSDFGNYAMVASNVYGKATSSIATLSMEQPPVPGSVIVQRYPNGGIRLNVSTLLSGATDPESNVVSLVGINTTSAAGGSVGLTNGVISYLPPAGYTNADAFIYTISDGHCGGTAPGTVLVEVRTDMNPASQVIIVPMTNGSVQVIFAGEPGTTYRIQATTSLQTPNWQDVSTNMADQFGTYIYTDWPATNGPKRYFQSVTP